MLAKTPPMGFNTWNTFGDKISDALVRESADAFIDFGLKDAGYEYVVIDDCWSLRERNEEGRIVPNPEKFPSGMKALADYVHSKGLKFGMYSCAGTRTCAGFPGSFDYEFIDAKTFAEWGVDFLNYDFCFKPRLANGPILYNRMSMALKASGREILFSACNWGSDEVEKWIRSTGAHMYRSTGDINDSFQSFKNIAMSQVDKIAYSGPGCYNDIDMLICGMHGNGNVANGGCSDIEYRTHFALWCLFGVPLMIGADLRGLNEISRELLLNRELIRIDQDPEGRAPYRLWDEKDGRRSYFRHLADGSYVLAYFNPADSEAQVNANFEDAGLPYSAGYALELTDVFTGETITKAEYYNPVVPAHGCLVYRARLVKR